MRDADLNQRPPRQTGPYLAGRVARCVLVALACLLQVATASAVGFPGPVALPLDGAALSALRVRPVGAEREYFVDGSSSGSLNLHRYDPTSSSFTSLHRILVGGRLVGIIPWLGRAVAQPGLVVATVDPDRIVFVTVNDNYPFLAITAEVALDEDPGAVAFVGNVTDGPWQLAVTLPGVDQVAFLAESPAGWSVSAVVPCGDRPASLASLDLDGDGLNDLVVAQTGALSANLAIFRRQTDASFLLQTVDLPGVVPSLLAARDLDGDGRPELAVSRSDAAEVVLFKAAAGQLVEHDRVALAVVAQSMRLAEMPDGAPGLFSGSGDRGLLEFATLEAGTWTRRNTYYPGCRPHDFAFADVDADGRDDLIALGGDGNLLTLMLAHEGPGFWGFPALGLAANPGSFVYADMDDDGNRDLLVADAAATSVSLFPGRAGGSFSLFPLRWDFGFIPGPLLAANLDADPALELAVLDIVAAEVVIMDYVPGTGFVVVSRTGVGSFPFGLEAADLDGDQRIDLLVLAQGGPRASALFGRGDGTIDVVVDFGFDVPAVKILPLDLNADGRLDVAATDGVNRVWTRLNAGGRSFGSQEFINAGPGVVHMASRDLDRDGDADLVVTNRLDQTLSFFENAGTGSLVRRIGGHSLPGAASAVLLDDFDGDGRTDVLVNLPDQGKLGLVFGVADWSYTAAAVLVGGPQISGLGVADLNLDGVPDILALDRSLLLGLSLLNVDRELVSVAASAFSADCQGSELQLRVAPDRPGPWILELGNTGSWQEVMTNGRSRVGRVDFDGGQWQVSLSPADLADLFPSGAGPWQGRLTIGNEGDRESALWPVAVNCSERPGSLPARLAWRREPWPNPFNPSVQARFSLASPGLVQADVYDLAGRRVATLASGNFAAGEHVLTWDGRGERGPVGAGAYLLRVAADDRVLSSKLMLVK